MTEKLELYKCNICGNLVQVILNGEGELVCCGQPMEHLIPQGVNEGVNKEVNNPLTEKHTPAIEERDGERFNITGLEEDIDALEMCNIHGLWKG